MENFQEYSTMDDVGVWDEIENEKLGNAVVTKGKGIENKEEEFRRSRGQIWIVWVDLVEFVLGFE